jgi:hypothetical protein
MHVQSKSDKVAGPRAVEMLLVVCHELESKKDADGDADGDSLRTMMCRIEWQRRK